LQNASKTELAKPWMSDTSIWLSLRNPVFRRLWFASVVSGMCVSAHDTAATWTVNTLSSSMFLISLLSTMAALPFFLFTLPAGAIADMVDRRRLLCGMNLWQAACAGGLALLGMAHLLNPYILLGSVFLIGVGFAFNAPVYSAVIPEIASKDELASAVTLGGLQLNVAAIVGPALAALLLHNFNANLVFGLNGICFLLVIVALLRWRPNDGHPKPQLENFFESFESAIRYIRYAPGIQVVLARNVLFAFFISIIPALLPVVGLKDAGLNSSDLGLLFTSMGIGSAVGVIVLIPRLRARFSPNMVTVLASLLSCVVFVLMAVVREVHLLLGVAALAGVAWTIAGAELWVAGQRAMPGWARGRMNATHIMLAQGAMALGGFLWGGSAEILGIRFTMFAAAAVFLVSLILALPLSIDFTGKLNLDPAPLTSQYHATLHTPAPSDGPVTITVEFQIDSKDRDKFLTYMREVRLMHLRNGAFSWRIDEDMANCHRFRLEMHVASWSEHLLQHERYTKGEQKYWEKVWKMDTRPEGPEVRHYLSVNKELMGGRRISPCAPPPAGRPLEMPIQELTEQDAVRQREPEEVT
jgi:MFS family permease